MRNVEGKALVVAEDLKTIDEAEDLETIDKAKELGKRRW